jgi:N,N'-diacetyllegionaminate synthase
MRPKLIAECCQNHNGDRATLREMIHRAAESGADYVKIQAIRSREVAFRERFEQGVTDASGKQVAIKRPYQAEVDRLAKLDLALEDEAWFVEECWRAGVAPMTTVFTRASAREVKELGYEAVKIASYDCRSYPLLRDCKQWWKTMVVSTGASFDGEIERAAAELEGVQVTFLHAVTIYPTPMHELHLRRMQWLRRFSPRVGLSDHTKPAQDGLWASKVALALGAVCVERHYTVLAPDQTRDGPVSINPVQLAELRAFADRPRRERMELVNREYPEWEKTLGSARRALSHAELLNRDYYAGRFAAKIGGREVYNWEDVDFDRMLREEA